MQAPAQWAGPVFGTRYQTRSGHGSGKCHKGTAVLAAGPHTAPTMPGPDPKPDPGAHTQLSLARPHSSMPNANTSVALDMVPLKCSGAM